MKKECEICGEEWPCDKVECPQEK